MPEPSLHNPLGEPFVELDTVDSTNNYALARLHEGLALHGTAFFAWEQFAGKGQRGKTWVSEKGNNLIISIVLNPDPLGVQQQFWLSACLAITVADWFTKYAGEGTCIKWPNDLYWHDRKAGGILVESIISGTDIEKEKWKWAVAGIGININQVDFNPILKNPVSLRQITGKVFPSNEMAKELCKELDKNWKNLLIHGFNEMLIRYNNLLYKRGQKARFRQKNRIFEATVKKVDENGKLWLAHGVDEAYEFGNISFEV